MSDLTSKTSVLLRVLLGSHMHAWHWGHCRSEQTFCAQQPPHAFPAGALALSYLARELTLLPTPTRCTRAGPILGVAGSPVEALAGQVTAKAPSAAGTADGAVHTVPACSNKNARAWRKQWCTSGPPGPAQRAEALPRGASISNDPSTQNPSVLYVWSIKGARSKRHHWATGIRQGAGAPLRCGDKPCRMLSVALLRKVKYLYGRLKEGMCLKEQPYL